MIATLRGHMQSLRNELADSVIIFEAMDTEELAYSVLIRLHS